MNFCTVVRYSQGTSIWTSLVSFIVVLLILPSSVRLEAQVLNFKHRNIGRLAGVEYVGGMVFSPDNKFAYTASGAGFGVFEFNAATGQLTMVEIENMQAYGIQQMGVDNGMGGNNIILSHDGNFAYATRTSSKDVYIFKRDNVTGKLQYLESLTSMDSGNFSTSLTISDDDLFLYVGNSPIVNVYKRNISTGKLTPVKRDYSVPHGNIYISNDGQFMYTSDKYMKVYQRNPGTGITSLLEEHLEWSASLGEVSYLAVTPDEKFIFAGTRAKGIGRFSRNATTGKLTFMGMFSPPGVAEVNNMVITPAGTRLYVTSYKKLTSYSIDQLGNIVLLDKIDNDIYISYYGLALSNNAEYIVTFGAKSFENAIETLKENSESKLESVKVYNSSVTLNKGLANVFAEAISPDNKYIYTASMEDKCFAAFQSGISEGGQMTEINRISFDDLPIPNTLIRKLVLSPDGKDLYAFAVESTAAEPTKLLHFNIDDNGAVSYAELIAFSTTLLDLEFNNTGQFAYITANDKTLAIYKVETSGQLTLSRTLNSSDMGYYWGPEQIKISSDGKWLLLTCMIDANDPAVRLFTFALDNATGNIELITSVEATIASYKNTTKLMLAESRGILYFVSIYPDLRVRAYTWDAGTGKIGNRIQIFDQYMDADWACLTPDENLLLVNSYDETSVFGFYEDGQMAYLGSEKKIGVISWSAGGGESGSERFLFPKNSTAIYAVRQSGNGVYVYERGYKIPPIQPRNVIAVSGDRQIKISWDKSKEADVIGYEIYREITSGGEGRPDLSNKIGKVTGTTFTDIDPTFNKYYYYVKAITADTVSRFSLQSNAVSPTNLPPAIPAGLSLQVGDKFLGITWNPNQENDLDHYEIFKSTSNYFPNATLLLATKANSIKDENVAYGTTYYYWVKAVDTKAVAGELTNCVSGTPINFPPAIPKGLALTSDDKFLSLSWNANSESDFLLYQLYKATTADLSDAKLINSGTALSFKDEDVEYLNRYYYYLAAVDISGNRSGFTTVVTGVPLNRPPATPTGLSLTSGDKFLTVSWNSNSETDFSLYQLYRATTADLSDAILIKSGTVLSVKDESVEYLKRYYYFVAAVDAGGNRSDFTAVVTGIPTDEPPATPKGFRGEYSTAQGFIFAWNANSEKDLQGYKVFRGTTTSPQEAEEVGDANSNETTFTYDAIVQSDVRFWLIAYDKNGNRSDYSEAIYFVITGTEAQTQGTMDIYPSPFTDFLYVKAPQEGGSFELVNMAGIVMKNGLVDNDNPIDVRDLLPGTYLCVVRSKSGVDTVTVIKLE